MKRETSTIKLKLEVKVYRNFWMQVRKKIKRFSIIVDGMFYKLLLIKYEKGWWFIELPLCLVNSKRHRHFFETFVVQI